VGGAGASLLGLLELGVQYAFGFLELTLGSEPPVGEPDRADAEEGNPEGDERSSRMLGPLVSRCERRRASKRDPIRGSGGFGQNDRRQEK
jgi:hypothetical protein